MKISWRKVMLFVLVAVAGFVMFRYISVGVNEEVNEDIAEYFDYFELE